jgi:hypothetical protein
MKLHFVEQMDEVLKIALEALAEASGFEVFLTVDHGIPYQQNLVGREIAIILVRAKSNQLGDLLPLADVCLRSLESIKAGEVESVG